MGDFERDRIGLLFQQINKLEQDNDSIHERLRLVERENKALRRVVNTILGLRK